MTAFGSLQDMIKGREYLAQLRKDAAGTPAVVGG